MRPLFIILATALLAHCTTSTPKGSAKQALTRPEQERIHWPERYQPDKSKFFVHNEIEIEASPAVVWGILIDAEAWPHWYEGAKNVKLSNSRTGFIEAQSVCRWKTMGMNFESRVKQFVPNKCLAWESRKTVIQGYHAWLVLPTAGGCKVITDESFRGPLGLLQGTFIPNKLHRLHQIFLQGLKNKAEAKAKLPHG